jgi:hypothetical protein
MEKPAKSDPGFNDPDRDNSEQNEQGTQTQDVVEDAFHGTPGEVSESEPGSRANPADLVPRDVPDLVQTIEGMVQSGRIDTGAFDGEDNMDDENEDEEYTRPRNAAPTEEMEE